MSFGATPLDGSSTPLPMSAVVPDGTNQPTAMEGGPVVVTGGNNLAPGSIYVKDGNDLTQGAQADAAWSGSGPGSVVAILKKVVADLAATLAISGTVMVTNLPGTQPVSGTVTVSQATGTNLHAVLDSGSTAATQSGTWTVQPGNTPNTSAWLMQDVVAASNGAVPYHNLTGASANFTNVKGAACQLYGFDLSNTSASAIYVKFYDKATAPTTGDTPKKTIQVPANGTVLRVFPKGLKFTSGFGWAATGAVGDSDNTSIAANCVVDFELNS